MWKGIEYNLSQIILVWVIYDIFGVDISILYMDLVMSNFEPIDGKNQLLILDFS